MAASTIQTESGGAHGPVIQDWGTGVGAGGSVYVRGGSIALHSITTSNTGVRGRSAVYYDTSFSQDTGSPDYQADLSPSTPTASPTACSGCTPTFTPTAAATPTLVPTHVAYTYGGTHVHAVVSLSTGDNYQYDANGNMTRRVAGGVTQTLIYNGENRLSEIDVAGAAVATFAYDGDGNKVSQTVYGVTTAYFAGGTLEVSGGVVKKYYAIGGQLVAMDTGGTLTYFLTDNLGSVVAVLDASGTLLSQQRYLPFGQVRTDVGQVTQTDHGYTGQKLLAGLNGLMDYNARLYDSYINRWSQPDTIIPDGNPQSLNRYAYVLNNPINRVDPTGHAAACVDGEYCRKSPTFEELLAQYGVSLSGNWTSGEKSSVLSAVTKIGNRLESLKHGYGAGQIFKDTFGSVNFDRMTKKGQICQGGSGVVTCYANAAITDRFIMHELGHSFDAYQGNKGYSAIQKASIFTADGDWVTGFHMVDGKMTWQRGLDGYPDTSGAYGVPDLYHGPGNWSDWNQLYAKDPKTNQDVYSGVAYTEEWADMFLNWADGSFQGDAGAARNTWMTNQISSIINP